MAPLPDIYGPTIRDYLNTILKRTLPSAPDPGHVLKRASPLLRRADHTGLAHPDSGVVPFDSIPNKAVFAIFGLIGAAFVVTGIWFFFWAKNGGFVFHENDWDDYKSTVLRRKGPNGTTISGATESTDLGGGSIVHGEKKKSRWGRSKKGSNRYKDYDEENSEMTSTVGSDMSDLKRQIKKDRKKARKESRLRGGDLGSEMTEQTEMLEAEEGGDSVMDAMRAYRHEKPARVGGLNKESDASAWDGSTNDNSTAASELLSNRERTPTSTPSKYKKERKDKYASTGGIRRVVTTSKPNSNNFWERDSTVTSSTNDHSTEEHDRIKAEAKRLQEKGRAAKRRDFSFQAGDDSTVDGSEDPRRARREEREARRANRSPSKKIPGSFDYAESEIGSNVSSDVGTKSYHHPIPGLSSAAGSSVADYAEERRKKRHGGGGGYRRGRRDSLSDDGR
ncbi:hypothetical protein HYALB_00009071 [Hymenoscyphus albidus]|uniref:Endosomal spry domain-containing protein n=1 Tax=Hymenoscyphus albidus TaxID=595503 RepID=A0A9N9Q2M2_9HELO|nr:hypothetical protein HYALB_00009071 [Hymenoscyphus albidus]